MLGRVFRVKNSKQPRRARRAAYVLALFLVAVFVFAPAQAGMAQEPTPTTTGVEETPEAEPTVPEGEAGTTRILVTISSRARIWTVMERVGGLGRTSEVEGLTNLGVFAVEVPSDKLEERMREIRNTSGVRFVETEQWVYATDTIPNDPGFVNQYALTAIRAPQGWDYALGAETITIAILDSGVDYSHPELQGRITAGHNVVACPDITLPCAFLPHDDYGHGTHVAGIAAANTNNGIGMAGVSWGARIMPVKVLNSTGGGTYENVANGIIWAVDNGAHVINMSLGGSAPSGVLLSAVEYAYANNVLMVASAGNTGSNFVLYPARLSQVIAVGASNMNNDPASFSNYGPEVELAAPGDVIYSLQLGGGYRYMTGTSMSAPHVSGLAAILLDYVAGADSVRNLMASTALDIGPAGWDEFSGAGLIQMDSALAQVTSPRPTFTPTNTSTATLTPTFTVTPLAGGGGGSSPPGGFAPPFFQPSPTGTLALLPPPVPASPTQTVSPPEADEGVAPAALTMTPTPTPTPVREHKAARLKVFLSPVFCSSVLLIALGIGLFWLARKRRGRMSSAQSIRW